MRVLRLTTPEEWYEADRLLSIAFLEAQDEGRIRETALSQARGDEERPQETWGLLGDEDQLEAVATTLRHRMGFGGVPVDVGEIHMVGSRVESRGRGNVRTLMSAMLTSMRERGDLFAVLIPFSYPFYNSFGFACAARVMRLRIPMDQLAELPFDHTVTAIRSPEDLAVVRELHDVFGASHTLARVSTERDWVWRGNGEFGEPDFVRGDLRHHTYVLWNRAGESCAYVTFVFEPGPENPFYGDITVTDLVATDVRSLGAVLAFLYRLRAKAGWVNVELRGYPDLAAVLPAYDGVRQTVEGHVMARVLDVSAALSRMPHPAGSGSYVVRVEDAFMPMNSGSYAVSFADGRAEVERVDAGADLSVGVDTLTQLLIGCIDVSCALLRKDTIVSGKEDLLKRVFVRRDVYL